MNLQKVLQKAALSGTGLFAAAVCAMPFAGTVSAAAMTPAGTIGENDAVSVQTEYNCNTHMLMAEVTNKLSADINPTIAFDQSSPDNGGYPPTGSNGNTTIKAGETRGFEYDFSGNNQVIPVKVAVDGHSDVTVDPHISCSEPVSFRVTQYSEKTVIGYLANNNSTYPQTVTLSAGINGARQIVTLQPGQNVLVSVPFESYPDQQAVIVTVSNGPDYESSYFVDLTKPLPVPPVPMPEPRQ